MSNKQKVVDFLKALETGAAEPVAVINPNKYIQHNLAAADGLAGLGELLKQLPPNSFTINVDDLDQNLQRFIGSRLPCLMLYFSVLFSLEAVGQDFFCLTPIIIFINHLQPHALM